MGRDLKLFFQYVTPSMAGMLIAGIYSIVDTFSSGSHCMNRVSRL